MLAYSPFGGITWQVLHNVVGLRRIGFDVWYVEDSDSAVMDPSTLWDTDDCSANVAYLARFMEAVGLGDRWVFRTPGEQTAVGARNYAGLQQIYRESDTVINLCGFHSWLPQHEAIRHRIYMQTDPVADQIRVAKGDSQSIAEFDHYDLLFSYGENLGAPDCKVPLVRYQWHPARPPVCLDWWAGATAPQEACLSTIANWQPWDNTIEWQGEHYHWRKDIEFRRFIDLPQRSPLPLELALGGIGPSEVAELRQQGWRVIAAGDLTDPFKYRQYILDSLGEFTIAKDQVVRLRSGWFSDRSASYLAAGRPVITQDTAFSKFLPTGRGLFGFETLEEILAAIDEIKHDYAGNCAAAHEIAQEYFAAEKVLDQVMRKAGF
jgi:hypothetical protein